MKTILIILLSLMSIIGYGQDSLLIDTDVVYLAIPKEEVTIKSNTISFIAQPQDFGLGLRYIRQIKRIGIYTSYSYGNYKMSFYKLKGHSKLSLGSSYHIGAGYIIIGLSKHWYRSIYNKDAIPLAVLEPISLEMGFGMNVVDNIVTSLSMDITRWEGCVGLGIKF